MANKEEIDTYAGYTSRDAMFFSSTEKVWHNKIRKLAEQYPNDITIIKLPEDNDGCIYAKMPVKWLKLQPPAKREYTEEQLAEMRERMMKLRQQQLDAKASSIS